MKGLVNLEREGDSNMEERGQGMGKGPSKRVGSSNAVGVELGVRED